METTMMMLVDESAGVDLSMSDDYNANIKQDGVCTCKACSHHGKTEDFDMLKTYVKNGGSNCPSCGSSQVEGDSFNADGGVVWQDVTCECGLQWQDQYELINIDIGSDHYSEN